jgi:serpin B
MKSLRRREVEVYLPKFKQTNEFGLGTTLKAMGMTDAFGSKADFSGMDGRKGWLYISAVVHKAFVDVNEEGTEAAAATAVMVAPAALPLRQEPLIFKVDHPFVFLIQDKHTGSILFLGRVMDPHTM